MFGIFNIRLDTQYGRGREEFIRLQVEIIKRWRTNRSFDDTLFAWKTDKILTSGLLAPVPQFFSEAGNLTFNEAKASQRGQPTPRAIGIKVDGNYHLTLNLYYPWSINPLITMPLRFCA
ncbi:hypothetical protein BJ170DRAFT_263240 [Xylariales sp. AK1849]|nr:hypothetical protein BJ170DRAFT_263240 [Xylariales sp. AK1849]